MLWEIDPASAAPLHEQVAGAVRRGVVDGDLAVDERLPTARALADSLAVDPNTVLRAYRTLRDEGVLEFRRGRGVRVTATAPERAAVVDAARDLVRLGARHGYGTRDLVRLLEELS